MLARHMPHCFQILARESDKLALIANAVGYTSARHWLPLAGVIACAARRCSGDAPIHVCEVALTRKPDGHRDIADRLPALREHRFRTLDALARHELMRRRARGSLETTREVERAHVDEPGKRLDRKIVG